MAPRPGCRWPWWAPEHWAPCSSRVFPKWRPLQNGLIANVCLNPVTAVFGVRNGRVLERPYSPFVEHLAREAAPVLSAEGVRTDAAKPSRQGGAPKSSMRPSS
jgi:hypothetical protein